MNVKWPQTININYCLIGMKVGPLNLVPVNVRLWRIIPRCFMILLKIIYLSGRVCTVEIFIGLSYGLKNAPQLRVCGFLNCDGGYWTIVTDTVTPCDPDITYHLVSYIQVSSQYTIGFNTMSLFIIFHYLKTSISSLVCPRTRAILWGNGAPANPGYLTQ